MDVKRYKPSEIAKLGLIKNSKGKADYYFVISEIKAGRLKARNYGRGSRPYWLVSAAEIERYNKDLVTA